MVQWTKDKMIGYKKISPDDLVFLFVTDSPEEAVNFILKGQERVPE